MHICLELAKDLSQWKQHLTQAREALVNLRDTLITICVDLRGLPGEHVDTALYDVAAVLLHAGAGVTALHITGCDGSEVQQAAVGEFLRLAGVALPGLTALHLEPGFPMAGLQAPQLRTLVMTLPERQGDRKPERVLPSWAPLLPQLTLLQITGDNADSGTPPPEYLALFTPATATHTLTHLTLPVCLCDTLLEQLYDHARSLQFLCVKGVILKKDRLGERTWDVRELRVKSSNGTSLDCEALERLPHAVNAKGAVQTLRVVCKVLDLFVRSELVSDTPHITQRFVVNTGRATLRHAPTVLTFAHRS